MRQQNWECQTAMMFAMGTIRIKFIALSAFSQEFPCVFGAAFSISETMHCVEMWFSLLLQSLYWEILVCITQCSETLQPDFFSLRLWKSDSLIHLNAVFVKFSLYFYAGIIAIRNTPMAAMNTIKSKVSKNNFRLCLKCAQKIILENSIIYLIIHS